jgi:glycerol-3-phosphate dehydrogenase
MLELYAKNIINASGSWTDEVLGDKEKKLVLSKGVHIVVSKENFNLSQSIYFDAIDKRMIFAIPRDDKVYIGTTDTEFNKEKDNLIVLRDEVKYLLNSVNKTFSVLLKLENVESSWVGLRPLVKDGNKKVSEVSREDEIFISKEGVITIAGGKLTGYRKMAERVIDLIFKRNSLSKRKSLTKNLKLFGNNYKKLRSQILDLGFTLEQFNKYYNNYGDECQEIFSTIKEGSKEDSVLIISEYRFCIKNEMCHTLLDFFSQRNSMVYYKLGEVFPFINQNEKEMKKIADISDQKWKNQLDDLKKYMNQITTFN